MQNVQFEGQTKTKLGNPEARPAVEWVTVNELNFLMKNKKTQKLFDTIIAKAISAAKVRLAAKKAKEIARASKSIEAQNLVGKLASCSGKKPENNEIFIVEGDSAGGSAKSARQRQFQAILPIKGKILNVEKKKLDQVLQNEEIRTIISALGTGIGPEFDISGLKYHKVVILSDADVDGSHIRILLLTFFFRYMKELIMEGHVYIGMPPLYKVHKGDKVAYAYDDNDLDSAIEKVGKGYQIQRYKGLGEMDPTQLWDTTLDPEKRNLMRVTIEDAAEADRLITILMGEEVSQRKQYIFEHANFNKEDSFASIKKKA
jgi:DNA gyrase subunit B